MKEQMQIQETASLKRVFNVEQKSYYEKLKAEMAAIARGRTPQEMRAEKDVKSLKEWVARRRKMIEFLETKEVPKKKVEVEVEEEEIDISQYQRIGNIAEIRGEIMFSARTQDDEWVVALPEKPEIGKGRRYKAIAAPFGVGGRLMFCAQKEDNNWVLVKEDGNEIGGKGYVNIWAPTEMNGEIFFCAETQAKEHIVVKGDGTEIGAGRGYNETGAPCVINGEIVFWAKVKKGEEDKYRIVKGNGDEIFLDEYSEFGDLQEIDGKIMFNARTKATLDAKTESVVASIDGRKIGTGKGYTWTGHPQKIGAKIFFPAETAGEKWKNQNIIVDEKGNETSYPGYEIKGALVEINDEVLLTARKEDGTWAILKVNGEVVVGEMRFHWIGDLQVINGEIMFRAQTSDGDAVVKIIGKEIVASRGYKNVGNLQSVCGKIVFEAVTKEGQVVVNEKGEEISEKFNSICAVKEINEKEFYVVGKKGDEIVRRIYSIENRK